MTANPFAALLAKIGRYSHDCDEPHLVPEPDGKWLDRDEVLAALTAAYPTDLAEAGKVLEGVTPGPWAWNTRGFVGPASTEDDQSFGMICDEVAECTFSDGAKEANSRFIAWCREGVPALIARIAAQEAQINGLEATVAEVTSDRAYIISANAGWEAAVEQGEATPAAEMLAKEMQAIVAADRWKGRDLSAAPPEKWSHLRPETQQFWIDTASRILAALPAAEPAEDVRAGALKEAAAAWEAFKGATISDDHFAAVERLDAAFALIGERT